MLNTENTHGAKHIHKNKESKQQSFQVPLVWLTLPIDTTVYDYLKLLEQPGTSQAHVQGYLTQIHMIKIWPKTTITNSSN